MSDPSKYPAGYLAGFLRFVGIFTQLAFVAAFMPQAWIVRITDQLHLPAFPDNPVAFYLARHLSLIYGFIGIALIVFSYRMDRYRDAVGYFGLGVIGFGVLQAAIDWQAAMPIWWTAGESISSICGGLLILWLDRRCE